MYTKAMKYVASHLTRHHFFHAPHRWFLALLLSPIHAAELHYQKYYHLQFAHARKLFLFDLSLVAAIFGLFGVTLYWWLYDPTISEQIAISITPYRHDTPDVVADRIKSGEHITFAIAYTNNSDQTLTNATLRIHPPQNYAIEATVPAITFSTSTNTFTLGSIPRGGRGTVEISGILFSEPNREDHFLAELLYQPSARIQTETRLGALILYARESVLQTTLELPDRLPALSTTMATLTLHNSYHHDLPRISVPFTADQVRITPLTPNFGTATVQAWTLPGLKANATAILPIRVDTAITSGDVGTLTLTPYLFPTETGLPQTRLQKQWTIVRPSVALTSSWENTAAAPGSAQNLQILIRNNGRETIKNISLSIFLPSETIDSARWLMAGNIGRIHNNTVTITADHTARLFELAPGAEISLPLIVPIKNWPTGQSTNLKLPLHLQANLTGVTSEFSTDASTPDLALGTTLRLSAEARYYTADGDQLGRGPLPPQVGKETKYALLLHLTNATAAAEAVRLTATLPTGVNWTNKTSVSRGQEITYDSRTRRLTWTTHTLPPLTDVSLFVEVGVTPTEADRGRTVPLLQNIVVEGVDSVLNQPLQTKAAAITSALTNDSIAQTIGTAVR